MQRGEKEIARILAARGLKQEDVYLMMMDDTGKVTLIEKENKK